MSCMMISFWVSLGRWSVSASASIIHSSLLTATDDPDFPLHKANHRQYLSDESKFKEVVKIEDDSIKRKIHSTYRLQYLKDVVLARILDDPTFSVLNSLIFFHQVDIVQHLQSNLPFLKELFSIFGTKEQNVQRKKDAVLFIQQCCAIAKSLQANGRAQLYQNFISNGLLEVIQFALKHQDASVRVAGTDILVSLIDHDALMVRSYIFKAIQEKSKPLTDTLIELLLIEVDLGVKAQMADAIKILLDPNANSASIEALGRTNSDFLAKMRGQLPSIPQTDSFIQNFYDESARKLFQPLKELEGRESSEFVSICWVTKLTIYSGRPVHTRSVAVRSPRRSFVLLYSTTFLPQQILHSLGRSCSKGWSAYELSRKTPQAEYVHRILHHGIPLT